MLQIIDRYIQKKKTQNSGQESKAGFIENGRHVSNHARQLREKGNLNLVKKFH